MNRIILLITFSITSIFAFSQQQLTTQYLYNKLTINPAIAGSKGTLHATASYRNQWVEIEGSPKTIILAGHTNLGKSVGIGANIASEKIGPYNYHNLNLNYSYQVKVLDGTLGMGINGGAFLYTLQEEELDAFQQNDPAFSSGLIRNSIVPNMGAGLYFQNEKIAIGISSPYLLSSALEFNNNFIGINTKNHYYLHADYLINVSNFLQLKPSTFVKHIEGSPINVDFNLHAILLNYYWIGAGYRSDKTWVASMLIQLPVTANKSNQLYTLAYSYDFGNSTRLANSGVSHEITLGLDLWKKEEKIKSPRFF